MHAIIRYLFKTICINFLVMVNFHDMFYLFYLVRQKLSNLQKIKG